MAGRRGGRGRVHLGRPTAVGPAPARGGPSTALLRATVGRHLLAFDLRAVRHVDAPGAPPLAGRRIDLRAWFGAAAEAAPQTLAATGAGGEPLLLEVDRGCELVRVPVAGVFPVPALLRACPALTPVRAFVELEAGLALLVEPSLLGSPGHLAPVPGQGPGSQAAS